MLNYKNVLSARARSTQSSKVDRNRGFTLIELMLTLAVAGALLAYGIPLFSSSVKNSRLTGAVNEFVSAIHLTRSEASKRGGSVIICRADDTDTDLPTCGTGTSWLDGWVVFADDPAGNGQNLGVLDAGDDIVAVHGPLSDQMFINIQDNAIASQIEFTATGFANLPANLGQRYIVFCDEAGDNKYSRAMTISNLGRPQVVDSRASFHTAPSCES